MNNLSRIDLLFSHFEEYLDEETSERLKQKIHASPEAQEEARLLGEQIAGYESGNRQQEKKIMEHLPRYIDGEIDALEGESFEKLLREYAYCGFVYRQLTKGGNVESGDIPEYPVPKSLTLKLENLIVREAKKRKEDVSKINLSAGVEQIINRIKLFLSPIHEGLAFMGDDLDQSREIEIQDVYLAVDVEAPNRTVRIFSPDGKELGRRISNEDGIVVFEDYVPGMYKIIVEGFAIQTVETN